jgi:hypothetical protein
MATEFEIRADHQRRNRIGMRGVLQGSLTRMVCQWNNARISSEKVADVEQSLVS